MGTTPRGWPYPELGDPANVPNDMANLANAIDERLGRAIASGAVNISVDGGFGSAAVTFPAGRFTSAPRVVATAANSNYLAWVSGITTMGVTLGVRHNESTTAVGQLTAQWIAHR